MLEQQEYIADTAFFAKRNEAFLEAQASSVIDGSELENGDRHFENRYGYAFMFKDTPARGQALKHGLSCVGL